MQVVIRCDAGATMGLGHVMRCLALAQAVRAAGGDCHFVLPDCPPAVRRRLEQEQFTVAETGLASGSAADTESVGRIAIDRDADAVVVDTYLADRPWMEQLRSTIGSHRRLLRLDDGPDARAYGDEWITGPIGAAGTDLASGAARPPRLLGPAFVLLRHEHRRHRDRPPEIVRGPSDRPRLLITFGGSDPADRTRHVLEGLAPLQRRAELTVLVGGAHPHADLVRAACDRAGVRCLRDVTDMAGLLGSTEIVCTAAGSTTWEACLHRCALVLTPVAANQRPIAELMVDRAGARLVPESRAGDPAAWASAVIDLLDDPEDRMARARTAGTLVDGFGADRVAMHLLGRPVRMRDAVPGDAAPTAGWTGQPAAVHMEGFAAALADPRMSLQIAHDHDERRVAIVRIDGAGRIDLATAPDGLDPALPGIIRRLVARRRRAAAVDASDAMTPAPETESDPSPLRWIDSGSGTEEKV